MFKIFLFVYKILKTNNYTIEQEEYNEKKITNMTKICNQNTRKDRGY